MSLTIVTGDLLSPRGQVQHYAVVNAVNCVGTMGKGIAREFRARYPIYYDDYRRRCARHEIQIGAVTVFDRAAAGEDTVERPLWIVSFPTKYHWTDSSRLAWIEQGMRSLMRWATGTQVPTIAMPALGCGNGGLKFDQVRQIIASEVARAKDWDGQVYLYAPKGEQEHKWT